MRHVHILCAKSLIDIPSYLESRYSKAVFEITKGPNVVGKPNLVWVENGIMNASALIGRYKYAVWYAGEFWVEWRKHQDKIERVVEIMNNAAGVVCISKFLANRTRPKLKRDNVYYLSGGLWGMPHVSYKVNPARFKRKNNYQLLTKPMVVMSISMAEKAKWGGIVPFLKAVKPFANMYGLKVVNRARLKGAESHIVELKKKFPFFDFEPWNRHGGAYDFCNNLGDREWPALLRSADIFVHPSHLDSWGAAVADSMMCAVPALVFDVTGQREVGSKFVRCHYEDVSDIRRKFEKLFLNEEYRKKIACAMFDEAQRKMKKHKKDLTNRVCELME